MLMNPQLICPMVPQSHSLAFGLLITIPLHIGICGLLSQR